jgi:dTDP-4-amino-4,6-dideoxygalactose transaminase
MTTPTVSGTTATARPAILGGKPAVTADQTDALCWPILTNEDEQAVIDVLHSGKLSIHETVTALEDDYRRWLGVRHAVAHCNGTSALHAAIHALDLSPGDEVIVPSATWWATVMPVVHAGCVPVFAETEQECLGLDPDDVESRITDRTRAIVVVHLFGMPSRMDELLQIAQRHNLRVLEDASHAHGATYHGKSIGTLADAAVFSMQGDKLCPSAEGGMLVTNDDELYERVIRFGHYERLLGLESPNRRFAATGFGFKFRMSPLSAAVARVQLRHLDERNRVRNENCRYLSAQLEKLGFETFPGPDDVERVYFEFLIGYDADRTGLPICDLVKALVAEGAQVSAPRYPLLHQQPMFTEGTWATLARLPQDLATRHYDPSDLPRTMAGCATLIRMPTFPRADRALLDAYATAFAKVLAHADEIPRESS